ncbi:MAG: segregation/condensation protein A [Candidatus Hadarchaeales archaeon]
MKMEVVVDEPFEILLHLVQEKKLDPWEVDIEVVMEVLSRKILGNGPDLRLSGRAMLSASTLLRMKAEGMGNGKEGNGEEILELPELELPELGPIVLIQHEGKKVTLEELLSALREALREVPPERREERELVKKLVKRINEFRLKIEELMEALYSKILSLSGGGEVEFSKLLEERTRKCAVRTLLLLLFLFNRGRIGLRQEEPFGEIYVRPMRDGDGAGEGQGTGLRCPVRE